MKAIGKTWLAGVLLTLACGAALAEVTATVDRNRVAMGDTLRLTITATDGEDVDGMDLRPLLGDFDILQRATSSSTRIVNGRASSTRTVNLDISPKREGTLRVPAMRVDNTTTPLILVSVGPAPTIAAGDDTVVFEAEIDRDRVYVQGQLLLTLRVQQAVNLDARSITELQLDDAFVKPLEQRSFQRKVNGRPWLVHEVRYAIFPEQSGILEIPSQTFTAREAQPRRSLFDLGASGRPIRRTTEALQIEVLPRPADFPGQTWLPATSVAIEESWSVPPESLKAGESATRTLRIVGEGLQGAQLPPVAIPELGGLKFYPDQPAISDTETGAGVTGVRVDSAALVPTQAGSWELPEVRIPWWDSDSEQVRYAVVPARRVSVTGAAASTPALPVPTTSAPIAVSPEPTAITIAGSGGSFWQTATAIATLGWLVTALAWLWSRRRRKPASAKTTPENTSESAAFKNLAAACAANQPGQARQALIAWASVRAPGRSVTRLVDVPSALDVDVEQWSAALTELEAANYRDSADAWTGTALLGLVKEARKKDRAGAAGGESTLALYPT
jgi:hypothetical protein